MLVSQNLRRRHDAGLISVINSEQAAHEGYEGLSGTYIALQKTVHLMAGLEVIVYLMYDAFLCTGKGKRQGLV